MPSPPQASLPLSRGESDLALSAGLGVGVRALRVE